MTRVVEFVEVVVVDKESRGSNRIDRQVNKWISKQEKSKPGYKLEIQDVKYHTQYRKGQDDMVHSVLIIWDWKKDNSGRGGGGRHGYDPVGQLERDLDRELRGLKQPKDFYHQRKPDRESRSWYETPDRAWRGEN